MKKRCQICKEYFTVDAKHKKVCSASCRKQADKTYMRNYMRKYLGLKTQKPAKQTAKELKEIISCFCEQTQYAAPAKQYRDTPQPKPAYSLALFPPKNVWAGIEKKYHLA
jgi:hypothetical protein